MKSVHSLLAVAAAAMALLVAGVPAQAAYPCQIGEKSATTCNLKDLFSELDQTVTLVKPQLQLRLPNLQVTAIDYTETFVGSMIDYDITVEVSNVGQATAITPQTAIVVTVIYESGSINQQIYLQRSANIAAGGSVRIPLNTVSMPPAQNSHTIQVIAVADPGTNKRPGGEVWEGVESDNQLVRSIHTYGF